MFSNNKLTQRCQIEVVSEHWLTVRVSMQISVVAFFDVNNIQNMGISKTLKEIGLNFDSFQLWYTINPLILINLKLASIYNIFQSKQSDIFFPILIVWDDFILQIVGVS